MENKLTLVEKLALLIMDRDKYDLNILEDRRVRRNILGCIITEMVNKNALYVSDGFLEVYDGNVSLNRYEEYVSTIISEDIFEVEEVIEGLEQKTEYSFIIDKLIENLREYEVIKGEEENYHYEVNRDVIGSIIKGIEENLDVYKIVNNDDLALMLYFYYTKIAKYYLSKDEVKKLKAKLDNFKDDKVYNFVLEEGIDRVPKKYSASGDSRKKLNKGDIIAFSSELFF